MKRLANGRMPRNVAKRIMKRAAESNEPVVVTIRQGKPSRVFGYSEHRKMVELPHRVKPWEHRKQKKKAPDPLGAFDAAPPPSVTRKDLYEDED